MKQLLVRLGFRFPEEKDEAAFLEIFVESQWRIIQAAFLLGAFLYYSFFLWDRIIDPDAAELTHAIRGLAVAPAVAAAGVSLRIPAMRRRIELVQLSAITLASIGLSVIYFLLDRGFDYGSVGIVLVTMFAFSLLIMRLQYFVAYCLISWAAFNIFHVAADNAQPGMLLINNMCVGTAVLVGIFSSAVREYLARRQFTTSRELASARLRIEELLHSMLPREIVARIQSGETGIADAHGEVSIIFADLVGFTDLSRRVAPKQLVELLNRLFSEFDLQAERFGIEKIKTIGDAYMAVAGITDGAPDHAQRAARFALEIQKSADTLSREFGLPVMLRVGLHVGPVVAGVIGTKRPAFDCWGEAVNIANRLESSAKPGGVLISEPAYWRLRQHFEIVTLGEVDLRGVGPAKVFVLQPPSDPAAKAASARNMPELLPDQAGLDGSSRPAP